MTSPTSAHSRFSLVLGISRNGWFAENTHSALDTKVHKLLHKNFKAKLNNVIYQIVKVKFYASGGGHQFLVAIIVFFGGIYAAGY